MQELLTSTGLSWQSLSAVMSNQVPPRTSQLLGEQVSQAASMDITTNASERTNDEKS